MFRLLAVFMIGIPIIEIWGLITIGGWIGAGYTIALVILTGVLGAWLAKREGLHTIQLIRMQLSKGELPGQALLDGACILVGGALLLTPGFFTDIIGFFLLVPFTRSFVKGWMIQRLNNLIKNGSFIIYRK